MKHTARYLFAAVCLGMLLATPAGARERYIVSGASGELGQQVVKELLHRGIAPADLILVSHRAERLAEYARLGAVVREGDVTRPETLVPAYAGGTHMVLIALGLNLKEPRPVLHKRAIDAAVKAGVKHIVYTSFTGANTSPSPIARDHLLTEQVLRASGARWTILRLGEYADRWVLGAARNMAKSGRAVQPIDERFSAPVTYADCAAAVAGAMLTPAAVNQVYEVTGPEKVTQTDIARVTGEVTGRKIEVVAGKPGEGRAIPMEPPPGELVSAPPPGGTEPDLPSFTPAQLADNAARFKQLTGRSPIGLKQMIEADKAQLMQ